MSSGGTGGGGIIVHARRGGGPDDPPRTVEMTNDEWDSVHSALSPDHPLKAKLADLTAT